MISPNGESAFHGFLFGAWSNTGPEEFAEEEDAGTDEAAVVFAPRAGAPGAAQKWAAASPAAKAASGSASMETRNFIKFYLVSGFEFGVSSFAFRFLYKMFLRKIC
jgi:hypothetical protein